MTTLERLLATLKSAHETYPIHEAVCNYAATRVGKPITKKDTKALEVLCPGWMFSIHSGNTWSPGKEIVFWKVNEYSGTRSELWVARGTGLSRWMPVSAIQTDTQNARYFKYAEERNAERAEVLNPDSGKPVGLAKAAVLIDQIALLVNELKGEITAYDLPSDATCEMNKLLNERTEQEFKL